MPQIGWLEILSVVIIAILVLGPKEFPIALKKIGTYIGKFKNTLKLQIMDISINVGYFGPHISEDKDLIKKLDDIGVSCVWTAEACLLYTSDAADE